MIIYSVAFDKKDYRYSIRYHNNSDDLQLDTNEEPLNSLKLSIATLSHAIRSYMDLDDDWGISIKSVRFAYTPDFKIKGYNVAVTCQKNVDEYPVREIAIATKVKTVGEKEHFPAAERIAVCEQCLVLYTELEKYLRGEKAQPELDMTPDTDAEEHEVIGDDMFDIFE